MQVVLAGQPHWPLPRVVVLALAQTALSRRVVHLGLEAAALLVWLQHLLARVAVECNTSTITRLVVLLIQKLVII